MGGKTSTTTQSVQIPPEVMARYNAVNTRAEDVAKQPFQQYGGQFVAPLTQTQQAGVQATSAASQLAQPFYGAATGLTMAGAQDVGPLTQGQIGYYESPYTSAVAAPTYAALRQQQGQELAQQQAQAIRSGAFGGDRSGLERANLMRQQTLGTAQALAPIFQQGYGQAVQTAAGQQGVVAADLARRMQAGQAIAGLGTGAQQAALQGAQAQIGAGTLEQQTQQGDLTARYQQFLQERGYPFQVAQFLANIAMGTGALSGSTTTTTQPSSFFSDERLKENVKPIGETFDGQTIYKYNYKGEPGTQIGLLAQDVERKHPEAVGLAAGYKTVNYDKATDEAAHRGARGLVPENWMGGAVEHPGSYARGGYALSGAVVDPLDMRSILESNRQSLSPFSMAGLYGGAPGQNPMGGMSHVPKPVLATPKLVTAGPVPRSPESGFREAVAGMESAEKFGRAFTDEKGLFGEKGPIRTLAGKVGLGAAKTPETGTQQNQRTGVGSGPPATAPGGTTTTTTTQPPAAANRTVSSAEDVLRPTDDIIMPAARGGVIHPSHRLGYAGLGKVVNPMEFQDPSKGIGGYIEDATEDQNNENKLPTPNNPGGGGGQSGFGQLASTVGSAATLASAAAKILPMMFASDERLKDNIRPVGKTYDGQNIYSYDFGDGATRMGLMAQEVLKRDPDAVGQRDGYLTLDYDRATQGAEGRYMGGVAPRMGYNNGGVGTEITTPEQAADAPHPADEVFKRRVIPQESGGRHFDKEGRPLTSSAGAIGIAQVMPKTAPEAAKLAGLEYDEKRFYEDPKYNEALGQAYFRAQYNRYGDPTLAMAAYNAGPGRVDSAIARARETGSDWRSFLPAETQKYIGMSVQPSKGVAGPVAEKSLASRLLPTRVSEKGEEEVNLKQILIPGLVGLGAMASSPSRYFGAAALQGLGAGAQAYANLEKQQADIDRTRAETPGVALESAQKAIFVDQNGTTWLNYKGNWITRDEWTKLGKPPITGSALGDAFINRIAGEVPGVKGEEKKTQTVADRGPSAPEAPKAPGAPGAPGEKAVQKPAEITLPSAISLTGNAASIAEEEARSIANQEFRSARDKMIQDNEVIQSQARARMQASQQFKTPLKDLAAPLASLAAGEQITPGALAPFQTTIVKYANAFLEKANLPPIASQGLTDAQLADKALAALSQVRTENLDQRAVSALNEVSKAIANKSMDRNAMAGVLSQALVDNLKAEHEAAFMLRYGENSSVPVGRRALEAYRAAYPQLDYQFNAEKSALQSLLLEKLQNGEPLVNYLIGQGKDPALKNRITPDLINQKYGVNLAKYFGN